jgi:hypothetical protein
LKVPTRYEAKLTEKWKEYFDMMLVRLNDREREPAQGHPMSQPMVSCNIQEIEPGWTLIYFTQSPGLKKTRLHSLLNFVENWKKDNPTHRSFASRSIRKWSVAGCRTSSVCTGKSFRRDGVNGSTRTSWQKLGACLEH